MVILACIMVFLKNAIYGLTVIFTGNLTESADVLDVLALRFLMSWVVLEILKQTKVLKINIGLKDYFGKTERSKHFMPLVLSVLFQPVLYMFLEAVGITMTDAIIAGVMLSLIPITSVIFQNTILKVKTSLAEKLLILIGMAGVLCIVLNSGGDKSGNSFWGILFFALAVISGSLYLVFSKKALDNFDAVELTYFAGLLAMVIFNSVNVARHLINGDILNYFAPYFNMENLIGFLFLAVGSTIIATQMNNFALNYIKVSTVSCFSGVSTLVTILAGVVLSGEVFEAYHIIGIALIVVRMIGVSVIDYKNGCLERT